MAGMADMLKQLNGKAPNLSKNPLIYGGHRYREATRLDSKGL